MPVSRSAPAAASLAVVLAIVCAAVYAPVREHDFLHYDDRAWIVDNPHLAPGLSVEGLTWAATATRDGSWIPVTWLSFLADQTFSERSPAGIHLVNVAIHSLAAGLLLWALFALTGSVGASAFAAAFFALHPLHVESVAWAAERKDVLSGFFFALSLWAYARYAATPSLARYLGVSAALTLGLLSKPMLVTLPALFVVLDHWPLRRGWRLAEKLPWLGIVALISALTFWSQSGEGAVRSFEALSLSSRGANAIVSYAAYLGKALWPLDLAIFYPHPDAGWSLSRVAAAAGLLLAISAIAFLAARRLPALPVGWLWYLGMLVPVIGLVQVGEQRMADRYTYLPLVGPALAIGFAGQLLAERGRALRSVVIAAALLAVVAMAVGTRSQLRHWRDSEAVFARALAVTRDNATARNGLAAALLDLDRQDEAMPHLQRALVLRPDMADAHVNLGVVLLRRGEAREAIPHLERGLSLPGSLRAPAVETKLGWARFQLGEWPRAVDHFRRALASEPRLGEAQGGLALALVAADAREPAEAALQRAAALGLESPELALAEAQLRERQGQSARAVAAYRRALVLRPGWPDAANNLAWLLVTHPSPALRQPAEALDVALSIDPAVREANPAILDTLAVVYAGVGRTREAVETGRRAAAAARAAGQEALAIEIEARVAGFEAGP